MAAPCTLDWLCITAQAKVRDTNAENPIRVGDLVEQLVQFHHAELVQVALDESSVPAVRATQNQQPAVLPPAKSARYPRVVVSSSPSPVDGPREPRSIYPRVIVNSDGPEWVHITSQMGTEEHKRTK